jgi:hypothetical protein
MDRMIDYLKSEHFGMENLRTWGTRPLKALTSAMVERDGTDPEARFDHMVLCEMVHDKACELDEKIGQLIKEGVE